MLMDKTFTIKIADFGVSRTMANNLERSILQCSDLNNHDLSFDIGTPLYAAPEILKGEEYGEKVDVYSLGIIYVELLCSFKTQHERQFVLTLIKNTGELPDWFQEKHELEHPVIKNMLERDPSKRYSITDLLRDTDYKKLRYCFT